MARRRWARARWLAPSGAYYEAFQSWAPEGDPAGERRDFRSLAPMLRAAHRRSRTALELGVAAGYRWLLFKPDRDFDFDGPTAGVNLRWLLDTESGADWEARAGAAIEYRSFAGPALVGNCPPDGLPCPGPATRTDDFLVAQADVTRTGRVLLGAGYVVRPQRVEQLRRDAVPTRRDRPHRHGAAARSLPRGARGPAVRLLPGFDPDPADHRHDPDGAGKPFVNIEDENRSSVRVDLSRDVSERLRALVRYTFYANELGSSVGTYRRQTLLLSLAFIVEK